MNTYTFHPPSPTEGEEMRMHLRFNKSPLPLWEKVRERGGVVSKFKFILTSATNHSLCNVEILEPIQCPHIKSFTVDFIN
jgi:hypothetical protein